MKRVLALIASCVAGAAIAHPTAAPGTDPGVTKSVSYADLNLASRRDQKRLMWRIRSAATWVCTLEHTASLSPEVVDPFCYGAALRNGLAQVDRTIATVTRAAVETSDIDELSSVRVAYGDLNLATDAGQKTLQYRIDNAARMVCGFLDSRDAVVLLTATVACRRDAVERARPAYESAIQRARDHPMAALRSAFLIVTSQSL